MEVARGLHHAERGRERGADADLAGRGLDEVRSGRHGEHRRLPDPVVAPQLAGLQDHLEVGRARRLARRGDLVVRLRVPPAQEQRAVEHDVDLVRAELHDLRDLAQSRVERAEPGGERSGDARDVHAAPPQLFDGDRHELRVQTDGGDGGDRRIDGVRPHRLGAHRHDLADGVGSLQRRQVHATDRQVERPELRCLLDRALGERCRALLQPDRVDGHGMRDQTMRLRARRQHGTAVAPLDLGWLRHRSAPPRCIVADRLRTPRSARYARAVRMQTIEEESRHAQGVHRHGRGHRADRRGVQQQQLGHRKFPEPGGDDRVHGRHGLRRAPDAPRPPRST